jgi:hypothetical protein
MLPRGWMPWVRPLLAVGVLLAARGAAWAEAPSNPCTRTPGLRPGSDGFRGTLPVNAPALVFFPPTSGSYRAFTDYEIELRDQDQDVVPTTFMSDVDGFLVRPGRELRGGELTVKYKDFCIPFHSIKEVKVGLTPASPLPTTIGTATQRDAVARYTGAGPTCLPAPVQIVVDVRMSPELAAYRAVTRWQVDYRYKIERVAYGELSMSDEVAFVGLADVCGPNIERVWGSASIAVHVAGASSDPPPLELMIDARCPDFGSPGAPPACNGQPPGPSNNDGGSSIQDGGTASSARARGCHLAGSPGGAAVGDRLAWVGMALLTALALVGISQARAKRANPTVSGSGWASRARAQRGNPAITTTDSRGGRGSRG